MSEYGWATEKPTIYAPMLYKYTKAGCHPVLVIYDIHGDLDGEMIVTVDEIVAELSSN
ncbi:hypothetical protein [Mycobacteroides abscessus]|uniref:hypothetical protein n=1 Tax=Mycobacteroides abscessus TaxID=36809 RepID=UPI0013FE36CA|nr:hypothetical protein [Mycobacteroides abscessus]